MTGIRLYHDGGVLTERGIEAKRAVTAGIDSVFDAIRWAGWVVEGKELHTLFNQVVSNKMGIFYEKERALAKAKEEREAAARRAANEEQARIAEATEVAKERERITMVMQKLTQWETVGVRLPLLRDYMRLVEQEEKAQAKEKEKQELQRAKEHEDGILRDVVELRRKNLTAIEECYGD